MSVALVSEVAGNATKSSVASLAVAVPAGGLPVGAIIVVGALYLDVNATAPSCSDSKGNIYRGIEGTATSNSISINMWVAKLTTALVSGDTITVTYSTGDTGELAIEVLQFSGVSIDSQDAVGSLFANPNSNRQLSPAGTVTAVAESGGTPAAVRIGDAVVAFVAIQGPTGDTFTDDTDTNGGPSWVSKTVRGTTGGSASGNVTLRTSVKTGLTSAAVQEYNPTLGTARKWSAIVCDLNACSLIADTRRVSRNHLLRR